MANWLTRRADSDDNRPERNLTPQALAVYNKVRLAALETDGVAALAAHTMKRLYQVDDARRQLAGPDATLNLIFGEIEAEAVQQCKQIQRSQRDVNPPFNI